MTRALMGCLSCVHRTWLARRQGPIIASLRLYFLTGGCCLPNRQSQVRKAAPHPTGRWLAPRPDVDEPPGDRRRRCHLRRHEVGAPAVALPSLEIAIRRRGAAFLGLQLVGIHPEAHGAAGLPPFE